MREKRGAFVSLASNRVVNEVSTVEVQGCSFRCAQNDFSRSGYDQSFINNGWAGENGVAGVAHFDGALINDGGERQALF